MSLSKIAYWRIDRGYPALGRFGSFASASAILPANVQETKEWRSIEPFEVGPYEIRPHLWKAAKAIIGTFNEAMSEREYPGIWSAIRERLAWPEATFRQLTEAINTLASAQEKDPLVLAVALATIKSNQEPTENKTSCPSLNTDKNPTSRSAATSSATTCS
jgi:hypothetical protein